MTDTELIKALGGPAKLAELLGYDKGNGGVQRVQNWLTRGIPAQVKLDNQSIFLKAQRDHERSLRATATSSPKAA